MSDSLLLRCIAATGLGLWKITPNHRPFTLTDPSISFPYVADEKISTTTLFLLSLVFPAIAILLVTVIFIPLPSTVPSSTTRSALWRRKLWEWNTAWLGLGLSLALSFLLTQGMKSMFGKPRPDLLSRCDPDYENQADYAIGGFPQVLNGMYLVSATICQQPNKGMLDDGFSSFPSGHSSYSWAGLLYLSLFLAAKFRITIPHLPITSSSSSSPQRTLSAAPPTYLLLLPLTPICIAIYISSTRYSDFRHHGFDIIFGSLMGSVLSIFTFRLYQMPLRRGAGWSWGPRSEGKAFGVGVGVDGFGVAEAGSGWVAGEEGSEGRRRVKGDEDLEWGKRESSSRETAAGGGVEEQRPQQEQSKQAT
ncbi:MAG: hypothetical protein Q9220_001186 [cf. Caloplaca sp. 1 TL-2023]